MIAIRLILSGGEVIVWTGVTGLVAFAAGWISRGSL